MAEEFKLFNKWSVADVKVEDIALKDYISTGNVSLVPHTAGRWNRKRFQKAKCPVVERLVNHLMYHGRNSGKKLMAARIVEHSFEIIHLLTGANPIQVYVDAIQKCGAREDTFRIGAGGAVRRQSVDVSPFRRVNQAIYLMTIGARKQAFHGMRPIAEALADEIINASRGTNNSFAFNKKEETERIAASSR